MKSISIRELHARTGEWVRQAGLHGGIQVTDHGKPVARIIPETEPKEVPYFARRKSSPAFLEMRRQGLLAGGTDSTQIISEMRDERDV